MRKEKNQNQSESDNVLPFTSDVSNDKGISLESLSKKELIGMVKELGERSSVVEYTRPTEPTIFRLTFDIREDLIDNWGAIIINQFSFSPGGEIIIDKANVSMPGFAGQGRTKDDVLFNLRTGRINDNDKPKKRK